MAAGRAVSAWSPDRRALVPQLEIALAWAQKRGRCPKEQATQGQLSGVQQGSLRAQPLPCGDMLSAPHIQITLPSRFCLQAANVGPEVGSGRANELKGKILTSKEGHLESRAL